ncbi:MAG: starch-binding protein [Ruminococcaceae bacterium]|nr:starch-binding protein [Oscillospiraceae bacterium]
MKSTKQILSLVLVFLLALSSIAFAASAEDFTPSEEPVLYFEVPENWGEVTSIFCHIWEYGSTGSFANWQSKKEKCTKESEGVYSYSIAKRTGHAIEEGTMYCVIFSADTGSQTYDLFFSTDCLGDTAYCDGRMYENPQDSNKTAQAAFWKHQDPLTYGPIYQITSIGNTAGTALPPNRTVSDLFFDFLTVNLENARKYSNKNDQEIIDNLIEKLDITNEEAAQVIAEAGVTVDWTAGKVSSGDEVPTSPDETTPDEIVIYGDANLDESVNIKDATLIQKIAAGLESISSVQSRWCADVNFDGYVNIKDATAIQKFVAGIESEDCIGTGTIWKDYFAPIDPVD